MYICYRYEYNINSVLLYGRGARLQQSARIYIYILYLYSRTDAICYLAPGRLITKRDRGSHSLSLSLPHSHESIDY